MFLKLHFVDSTKKLALSERLRCVAGLREAAGRAKSWPAEEVRLRVADAHGRLSELADDERLGEWLASATGSSFAHVHVSRSPPRLLAAQCMAPAHNSDAELARVEEQCGEAMLRGRCARELLAEGAPGQRDGDALDAEQLFAAKSLSDEQMLRERCVQSIDSEAECRSSDSKSRRSRSDASGRDRGAYDALRACREISTRRASTLHDAAAEALLARVDELQRRLEESERRVAQLMSSRLDAVHEKLDAVLAAVLRLAPPQ